MKNKIVYKFSILFVLIMVFFSMQMMVFAKPTFPLGGPITPVELGGGVPGGGSPASTGGGIMGEVFGVTEVKPSISDAAISNMTSEVLGIVKYVGIAIALGMVLYAGMKYMMSAANDKAELKNASIRLVIGAIIIAGASVMFPALWDVFSKISK